MSRRPPPDISLSISLARNPGNSNLSDQIVVQIRAAILDGTLPGGERLPSIRTLSVRLSVARATVDAAYAQLAAEGYLESKIGSGTHIARQLPEKAMSVVVKRYPRTKPADVKSCRQNIPFKAVQLARDATALVLQKPVPLAFSAASEELSPGRSWRKITVRLARKPWLHSGYVHPAGHYPLRQQIADYARRVRGIHCEPEHVVITSGTQQGLSLSANMLFSPGDAVWLENPCYQQLVAIVRNAGLRAIPVPVDSKGIMVHSAIELAQQARGAFVTPSHQFPLGMVMAMERRLALLSWAQMHGSWIIEDDYDSELRYSGRPFPALKGLDEASEMVVYLGTFSKMMFPGIRLGYIIAPPQLSDAFVGAKLVADRQSATAEQIALTEYMESGEYEAHIRRIRLLFAQRRSILLQECETHLAKFGEATLLDQGMHVVFKFRLTISDVKVAARILSAHAIEVSPLSSFYAGQNGHQGLLLGFGGFKPDAIRVAVQRIKQELEMMSAG